MRPADFKSLATIFGLVIVVGLVAVWLLPDYWIFLATSVLISAIALQSLGVVFGRTGMISLCQMSFAGIGAWVVGWLNAAQCPGGLTAWILLGGLAAVPFGVAIGLPALRLRGINLAIVTLGFASAFDAVLATITFPGQTNFLQVARPAWFDGDRAYFVYVLIFYAVVAAALDFISRTRLGAAWLSIRHSERAAAATGVIIPTTKLSAFAISAFLSGVSGGLLAGMLGTLVSDNFNMMQSLVLFVVATMTGAHLAEGALIGALLMALFPELLRRLGLPQDVGSVFFALGATQALASGETSGDLLRRRVGALLPKRTSGERRSPPEPIVARLPSRDPLRIEALTVRYGNVLALSGVDLVVPSRTVIGLVGPNGAGKSTLIDAVTGFLAAYEGVVKVDGASIDGAGAHVRARAGVRRTWQTTRISPALTVGGYLSLGAPGLSDAQRLAVIEWIGCPGPEQPVSSLDAGARRMLDVAGVVAGRPTVILLDEPAAGQSYDEAVRLGRLIAEIPSRFGSAVLLVEHDMDLVRAACSAVTVLDFGRVIASGPTEAVLVDPKVRKAYLGIEEEADAA